MEWMVRTLGEQICKVNAKNKGGVCVCVCGGGGIDDKGGPCAGYFVTFVNTLYVAAICIPWVCKHRIPLTCHVTIKEIEYSFISRSEVKL